MPKATTTKNTQTVKTTTNATTTTRDLIKKAFGESLFKQRRIANKTLESLAVKSNMTLRYVQDLEAGNKLPSILSLVKLCVALNISADKLLEPAFKAYKKHLRIIKKGAVLDNT